MYGKMLNQQYKKNVFYGVIFNTAYGPHDNFNPEKTKVMGSLIKKFIEAKKKSLEEVVCWGTGQSKREFIYCDDAAEALCQTLEKYDDISLPLNIGFEEEITIKELTEKVKEFVGYKGNIVWDKTKPDGQMRKILSNKRMVEFDIKINKTSLDDGIKQTIKWVLENENI